MNVFLPDIQEATEAVEGSHQTPITNGENAEHESLEESRNASKDPTAEKILALFSEIGQSQVLHKDFHPWFFYLENNNCGKMQTV